MTPLLAGAPARARTRDRGWSTTLDRRTRAVDLLLCSLIGLLALPLGAVIALAVRLSGRGPVLHHSVRVGRDGEPFRLHKFRTMRVATAGTEPAITLADDPRVTRLGRWLRRSKLDELPQLVNVVRGEMSLVGPRPEDPRYVDLRSPVQRAALRARPGLTSPASLAFRNESDLLTGQDWEQTYRTQVLPAKLAIDCAYLADASVPAHLRVLVRTLATLVLRRGGPAAVPTVPDPR